MSRPRRGLTFSELAVGLLFVAIAALACLSPAQSDTFWALRAGEDIWRTGRIPLVDTYSYTAAGRPWPNHEWLWQAIIYGLHRVGGFPLVALFASAVITSAYAVVYRLAVGPLPLRLGLLALAFVLGTVGWSLRPQIISLLMVSVLLWALMRDRLWLLPPLFALWANLHGGVALGGTLLCAATLLSFVLCRRRTLRLALVTGLAGLATLATPLGFELWRYVFGWAFTAHRSGISEWAPFSLASKEGAVLAAVAIGFSILAWRTWRMVPTWPDRMVLGLALVVVPLALRSARNWPAFLLVAAPVASRMAAALVAARMGTTTPAQRRTPAHAAVVAAGLAAAVAVVAVCWSIPLARLGWRPIQPEALAAARDCRTPMYNSYDAGGVLTWFLPERPVFIDSRYDPYAPELALADRLVEQGADFRPLFDRYGFKCALVAADARLAVALRAAAWRSRYGDSQWVVLERP